MLQRKPMSKSGCCPAANQSDTLLEVVGSLSDLASSGNNDESFNLGQQVARQCILNSSTSLVTNSGWTFHNQSGLYSSNGYTDYLLRAREMPCCHSCSCHKHCC